MDIEQTLEAVREIDRLTKENPAIVCMMQMAKDEKVVLPAFTDSLITVSKAAKILGTSIGNVGKYVNENRLPCYYLPGQTSRRFRLSDLQIFMDSQLTRG